MALPTLVALITLALATPTAALQKAPSARGAELTATGTKLPTTADAARRQELDARLARFEAANAGNPGALAALRAAGADVARSPDAYLRDGRLDAKAMGALFDARFARAGRIAVPTPPAPRRGANVAMGDVTGDGVAQARSGGVRVATGDVDGDGAAARASLGGVRVATGDLNGLSPAQREELQLLVLMQAARDARSRLDAMSELGETRSIELQMAMDRKAKLESMISNVMKKQSEASQSMIQNMK